jgi:hypothetical protein
MYANVNLSSPYFITKRKKEKKRFSGFKREETKKDFFFCLLYLGFGYCLAAGIETMQTKTVSNMNSRTYPVVELFGVARRSFHAAVHMAAH